MPGWAPLEISRHLGDQLELENKRICSSDVKLAAPAICDGSGSSSGAQTHQIERKQKVFFFLTDLYGIVLNFVDQLFSRQN